MTGRLIALLFLFLAGCSPFHQGPPSQGAVSAVVEDVHFPTRLGGRDCGPAALSCLLAHRGAEVATEEIARELYIPELGGSLLPDLENYAGKSGFATRSGSGSPDLLRAAIAAGIPVLVMVEAGFWVFSSPHYLVVYGYDEGSFLVHGGEEVAMDGGEFLSGWEKMNNLYLYLE